MISASLLMLDASQQMQLAVTRRQELELRWDAIRNNDLLNLLVMILPDYLGADRCGLFVMDPDSEELWLEAGTALKQRQICVGFSNSMVGQCVKTGSCINRSNLENIQGDHQQIGQSVSYSVSTALTVPIFSADHDVGLLTGGVVGTLQVLNRKDGQPFDHMDQIRLESVAKEVQPSVQEMYTSRKLVQETVTLDKSLEVLRERVNTLRPGKSLHIFEPVTHAHPEGFLHHRWHGHCYPPFIDKRATDHLNKTWHTNSNDIFIVSHLRAGNYLAKKYLVELIREHIDLPPGNPMATGDIGQEAVPWPELMLSQESPASWQQFVASTVGSPRLWYLHCRSDDLPCRQIHPETKFVVAIRDPRAVLVSQYFFWIRHPLFELDPNLTLERFTEIFVQGDIYFGNYFQHVRNWINSSERISSSQICVLRYEDMVGRKLEIISKLQSFLFDNGKISQIKANSIASLTSFEAMKESLSCNPGSFPFNSMTYFRSGRIDNWRKHLSPHSERMVIEAARLYWEGLEKDCLLGLYLDEMNNV